MFLLHFMWKNNNSFANNNKDYKYITTLYRTNARPIFLKIIIKNIIPCQWCNIDIVSASVIIFLIDIVINDLIYVLCV